MIFDGRWKYIRCEEFEPIMFELQNDPNERVDIGTSDATEHTYVRRRMEEAILRWATRHHTRISATPRVLESQKDAASTGILIWFWDEAEFFDETGIPFEALTPFGKG